MKVTFRGPENQIETAGFGTLKKGIPFNIPDLKYACDLCSTGRCDPSDDAAKSTYEKFRGESIDVAAAASEKIDSLKVDGREKEITAAMKAAALIHCDRCLNEVDGKVLKEMGCPHCPKPDVVENATEVK